MYQKTKGERLKKRKAEPTVKLKKYVKGVIEGKSKFQAALAAGYSKTTAANTHLIETGPGYQTLMSSFEKEGLNTDWIAKKIKEGGDATKIITSPTEADKTVPDYDQRGRYVDRALKVMGFGNVAESKEGSGRKITLEEWTNEL